MRVRLPVAYDGGRLPRLRRERRACATVGGTLRGAHRAGARPPRSSSPCAGRTDAGVHAWGQVVTFDAPADGARPRRACSGRSTGCAGRPSSCAAAESAPPTTSTPASRPRGPALPLHGAEPAGARPVPRRHRVARARAARPARAAPRLRPAHRRARLHVVLPARPRRRPARRRATLVRRVPRRRLARRRATACCASRSRPTPFCHQMVRSLVGTLVDVGRGRRRRRRVLAILAGA